MSIDTRIREGYIVIRSALPEVDTVTAYDVVVRERSPRRTAPSRGVLLRLVAAAASTALVAGGLLAWLHHDRTPTVVRPGPTTPWVLMDAPVGSPYNPSPRRGMRMLFVSARDLNTHRGAALAGATLGAWSPDGQRIAFAVRSGDGVAREIWVTDFTGGSRQRVYACSDCRLTGLDWSPDGSRLALTVSLTNGTWRLRILTLASSATQDVVSVAHELGYPRWSPDGSAVSLVETRRQQGYLDVVQPAASTPTLRPVVGPVLGLESADWSPDGSQLAFTAGSPTLAPNTHADLYVVNADGSGRHRITAETSGTRLMDVEWERHGAPFLVSDAIGTDIRAVGLVSTVTADGHLQPVGGTGIVPGVDPRLRP